jgi:hypothetical protein
MIHVIGGGSRNELLCQFTADATGLPVVAGPAEATAMGNIMVQALGLGFVRSLAEIRSVVRRSVELKAYTPRVQEDWEGAFRRFRELIEADIPGRRKAYPERSGQAGTRYLPVPSSTPGRSSGSAIDPGLVNTIPRRLFPEHRPSSISSPTSTPG